MPRRPISGSIGAFASTVAQQQGAGKALSGATSAASECKWSVWGHIYTKYCNKLSLVGLARP
eukprot:364537-Chlamydomonas_euryale.AAC.9